LAAKGLRYADLKTALVPSPKKREVAFIFDTPSISDPWYGLSVNQRLMPLFSKESNHSVLAGDYIGENHQQDFLYEALCRSAVFVRDVTFRHSSQFYIIYINNLSDAMVERFHSGLREYPAYAGMADLTFSSILKFYLSTILVNAFIKHRRIILMGHEDDRDNEEDVNMVGYPFEEFGFSCRSLQSMLYGVLLSYKIERPVVEGFETDTEFSINAVSPLPMPLSEFEILIEEDKFGYLAREKAHSLRKIGLLDGDLSRLKEMIATKISSNYIYNMCYDEEHNTTKFDIILEFNAADAPSRFRVMVAMEYVPEAKRLRLITLY
jgi:hypothetical protein